MRQNYLSLSLQLLLSTMALGATHVALAEVTTSTAPITNSASTNQYNSQYNNQNATNVTLDAQGQPTTVLDPIVITTSSGGITPTVNQQTIEKSNIIDMKDVLKDQPSLSVSGGNGLAQQLYIRNFGENELTFSVDNTAPNSQLFHHQSRFMFDPALLKSMNIEKGTGQANSGIGVTAGAIRMTTVDANDMLRDGQNVGAMVGAGYNSNKGYRGVGAVYGRSDDHRFDGIVMGNYVKHEDYKDGNGDVVTGSTLNQEAYMAKLGWNVDTNNRLELSHRREQQSGDLPLRANVIVKNQPIMDSTTTQDTTNLAYEGYNLAGREGVDVTANAYYSQLAEKRKQIRNISTNRVPVNLDIDATTKGANASVTFPIINNHRLETGLNYRDSQTHANNQFVGTGHETKTETGAYAQMNWDFNPVTLSTGVRYDHYDITTNQNKNIKDGMTSPSVSARWQVNDNFAVNGSWSQAIQAPRVYESLILGLSNGLQHDFADGLKPGKAQTTEVGIEWQGNNGFMADASIFDQRIKDYIKVERIKDISTQVNGGELKNTGYEVNVGYRKDAIKAFLGMSHTDSDLNGDYLGYALDIMPTGTKYNASVSYRFDQPRLEIGVKNHYVSDYSYQTEVEDRKTKQVSTVHQDVPSYFVTDVFANWQPLATDRLSINAGINNIANKQYYNQSNNRRTPINYDSIKPEKGREFRVGVNYKF
ncbi:TonB-dependent receptor domain-containing protein [Psychrobacter sp. I-STPA6b]|uniref:TonB-dependent receptor domain-containing protein n=1 Tax=Psychrobacter sp. I-STPA6b TaxID=2585718 RepID=UPI001D0C818E|nr:TonB-dependent receptor [Psychrobacter sp. I-STPA6b]